MKKTLPFILLISSFTFSQNIVHKSNSNSIYGGQDTNRKLFAQKKLTSIVDSPYEKKPTKIKGSKYFTDSFLPGKIYVEDKEQKEVLPLRYNAYEDLIEIQNGKEIDILIKHKDIACHIYGHKYIYKKYLTNKKEIESGYLKTVLKGKEITFFVKQKIKLRDAKPAKTSHSSSFPAKFVQYETYYFLPNTKNVAIILNKKSLLKELKSENKDKMKHYMKKQKINLKNKNDIKKVFNYYNSLKKISKTA